MANEGQMYIYDIFEEIVSGKNGLSADDFDGTALKGFAKNRDLFWQAAVYALQHENAFLKDSHYGIRESDFTLKQKGIDQSFFEKISKDIDIDDIAKSIENIKNHWNESLQKMFDYYYNFYTADEKGNYATTGEAGYQVRDILRSDAGYDFESKYVRPQSYKPVSGVNRYYADERNPERGNDQIESVLNNIDNLQFTQFQLDNSSGLMKRLCRLLMPEYNRTVQIEDLNRNFWVIGNVLRGICDFLFSNESWLNNILNGLFDELAQVWENLLYLWINIALITQKQYDSTQIIIVTLNNADIYPYKKFDGFSGFKLKYGPKVDALKDVLQKCWQRLSYLEDIYTESKLLIIPEIRQDGYQKNYYYQVLYPGAIILDRSLDLSKEKDVYSIDDIKDVMNERVNVDYIPFITKKENELFQVKMNEDYTATIGDEVYENISGIHTFDNSYHICYPYSSAEKMMENGCYVAGIRTRFGDVSFESNSPKEYSFELKVNFYDFGLVLYGDDTPLLSCSIEYDSTSAPSNKCAYVSSENKKEDKEPFNETFNLSNNGYYRGEFASWYRIKEPIMEIKVEKKWINGDSEAKEQGKVKIQLLQNGIEFKCEELEYNGKSGENLYFSDLPAYDYLGDIYDYEVQETTSTGYWNVTYENNKINYDSKNKIATITNTWTKIQYNEDVKQIDIQVREGEKYNSITEFLSDINPEEGEGFKEIWKKTISTEKLDNNTAKIFYSHISYIKEKQSIFECFPYLTLAIKYKNKDVQLYNFIIDVEDNDGNSIHEDIKYPYISSLDTDIGKITSIKNSTRSLVKYKTEKLKDGTPLIPPTSFELPINNEKFGANTYPLGNIYIKIGDITFNDNMPKLSNFIIFAKDRGCAGVENYSLLFPYFYMCEINQQASLDKYGSIKAAFKKVGRGNKVTWDKEKSNWKYALTTKDGEIPDLNETAYTDFIEKFEVDGQYLKDYCEKFHNMIER